MRSLRQTAALVASAAALAGCTTARAHPPAAAPVAPSPSPTPSSTPSVAAKASALAAGTTATPSPSPSRHVASTAAAPPFRWHSAGVTAAQLGKSWRAGCPVGPSQLRAVTLSFWGFDRRAHAGTLVVNRVAVTAIVGAFRQIYANRFPIRKMVPIAAYGGSDNASMAADNTSGFNCRTAVANGPKQWSMHAYGEAVDIDPLENPYTLDGRVYPPAGKPYTDRSNVRRGMIVRGSRTVRAFSAVGWGWGGYWSSSPDYQHFSSNGK